MTFSEATMTETQMAMLAQWLLIGSVWLMLIIYALAALRSVAYEQKAEIRNSLPTRPAKCLVTMVKGDAIGQRPWWKAPESYALPMYRKINEQVRLLQ
jgi:hypothetical protein